MRFKADVSSLLTFTRVCESLNKLTKRCVLKLTPEMVHFIVSSGEDAAGVQVWASVSLLSTVDPLESKFDAKQSIRTCSFRSSMAQACNGLVHRTRIHIRLGNPLYRLSCRKQRQ